MEEDETNNPVLPEENQVNTPVEVPAESTAPIQPEMQPAAPSTAPVATADNQAAPQKKSKWWIWLIVGCAAIPVLLIVFGILAGIIVGIVGTNSKSRAFDAQKKADSREIQVALEQYFVDNNKYPTELSQLSPKYLSAIPASPDQDSYTYTSDGKTYTLSVKMENTSDTGPNVTNGTYTLNNKQ